jgi:hypothetical protein
VDARAVSARKLLTPLAVLVPVLAAPLAAFWITSRSQLSALLLLVAGIAVIAAAGYFTYGLRTTVLAAILTWAAMVLSFPVFWGISINTSICGKDIDAAWGCLAPTAGVLAFLALGAWGLRAQHASWAVPLGYVAGFGVMVLPLAAVPGTPGFCET